jgi:ADP-dependent NAD(P)H-hydrate dehydratase / NAD(P)H-hydrate epimerase
MKIATAEIMRKLDRRAIDEFGIPGLVLMENAARGTINAIARAFPELLQTPIGIFAGRGNNGGDAFAVARYLLNRGAGCRVYLLAAREEVRGDAGANLEILTRMGGEIVSVLTSAELGCRKAEISRCGLIIDGIFGTGLNAPVTGLFAEVIDFINSLAAPVAAIDIPSGLQADRGEVLGACIKADLTVTFGLAKRGLVVHPGIKYCGKLVIVDISIPRAAIEGENIRDHLIAGSEFPPFLSPRDPESHKGTFGHLFVLAGSGGKTGAAAMVSLAANRVGTGLVTLGIPRSLNLIVESKLTESMTEPLPETPEKTLGFGALARITELLERKSALAIGPGLSTNSETVRLVQRLVRNADLPMVVDADGLNALEGRLDALRKNPGKFILTPHPGEMARLAGRSTAAVQKDRMETARNFAAENGVVLILKGARSVVAGPDGQIYINPTGNPGMASGGMGDVLTGMLGGFLAQGFAPLDAARFGVYLHGLAGDLVAHQKGERGILATDLIEATPGLLKALARGVNRVGDFAWTSGPESSY